MKHKKPMPITRRLNTMMLIEVVAADLDRDPDEVREVVMTTFDVITRAAAAGFDVAVTNFGTWVSYRTKRRTARNPQTGEKINVSAHQTVRFRASEALTDAVRRRLKNFTICKAPRGSESDTQP